MPDLNRLVRQVSEALGSAAAPDRVESILRILLDELAAASPDGSVVRRSIANRAVVTVSGSIRPDLRVAIEAALVDGGCTVHSTVVDENELSLTVLLTDSAVPIPGLQSRLDAVAATYGCRAGVLSEELFHIINGTGRAR